MMDANTIDWSSVRMFEWNILYLHLFAYVYMCANDTPVSFDSNQLRCKQSGFGSTPPAHSRMANIPDHTQHITSTFSKMFQWSGVRSATAKKKYASILYYSLLHHPPNKRTHTHAVIHNINFHIMPSHAVFPEKMCPSTYRTRILHSQIYLNIPSECTNCEAYEKKHTSSVQATVTFSKEFRV